MAEFRRKIKEIRLHKKIMMPLMMMIKVKKIVSRSLRKKRVSKRAHNSKRNVSTWMRAINEICTTSVKKMRKTLHNDRCAYVPR